MAGNTRMAPVTKYSISALPLPPPSKLLIHNLTPDTATPSVSAFKYTLQNNPSIQRRARIIAPQSHYSHVSPFPLPFPYEIEPPEVIPDDFDKQEYVEQWLSEREALKPRGPPTPADADGNESLEKRYPAKRENPMELLGLSETGLRDCLPHLDVGDAFEILGNPSLLGEPESQVQREEDSKAVAARQELVDVLGGHALLISSDNSDGSFAPWSLRYSGHQFGNWAGQLGDGRAISIPQGGGRTPFSRGADGLAVVRSSIREYLCAEVLRERRESACIVTRVAPSFLRLGSFEALNPPVEFDLEALRVLGEWVANQSAKRNARMVAGWQAYGWMHGVINTDNVSVLGLTIDYGGLFALKALLNALAPLVGAEAELGGKAVSAGWSKDVEKISICGMRKRLGLRAAGEKDGALWCSPACDDGGPEADFHLTFRHLTAFRPGTASTDSFPSMLRRDTAQKRWRDWLEKFAAPRSANPRFVLRQWVLEEVGRRILSKVMQTAEELDAETREERRFCGVGDKKMFGFQCSCSS
ncbi:hypothetical protein BC834DRAFT_882858 [Gloeopeniophorella convolvens]|nr:hypothetical protein BC834DRAFT_882858 [Gloeopeniophorella convolvens]